MDLPTRQQTLRRAIDWSYDLLDEREQALFRLLGVFVGGCTVEATKSVCDTMSDLGIEVLEGVTALLNKSLLQRAEGTDGRSRFAMMESIREYALERLTESSEAGSMRQWHAQYYLALVEQAEQELRGSQQLKWLQRLEAEHDNFRAALEWAIAYREAAVGLGLAGALQRFWWVRGHLTEGRRWLGAALTLVKGDGLTSAHAKVLNGAGILATMQGDIGAGHAFHEEALRIGKAISDGSAIASALLGLGIVAQYQREYGRATTFLEEGLALDVGLAGWQRGWMLFFLGVVAQAQYEYGRATALVEESLGLFREAEEQVGIAEALHTLGSRALWQDADERATALFEESLALFRELGDRRGIAKVSLDLGWMALRQDADEQAASLFEESLALSRELGDRHGVAYCLDGWSALATAQGLAERAARLGGAAEALRAALRTPLSASERTDLDHSIAPVRAQLNEATFAAAWAEGRAMPLEQAIAYALEGSDADPMSSTETPAVQ